MRGVGGLLLVWQVLDGRPFIAALLSTGAIAMAQESTGKLLRISATPFQRFAEPLMVSFAASIDANRYVFTTSRDQLYFFHLQRPLTTLREARRLVARRIASVATITPDGEFVVYGTPTGIVTVLSLQNLQAVREIRQQRVWNNNPGTTQSRFVALSICEDGSRVAAASFTDIAVLTFPDCTVVWKQGSPSASLACNSIMFSLDDQFIAATYHYGYHVRARLGAQFYYYSAGWMYVLVCMTWCVTGCSFVRVVGGCVLGSACTSMP